MSERTAASLRESNGYNLLRYRAYTDVWYTDRLRLYIEFLSQQLRPVAVPLPIDRNLAEFQKPVCRLQVRDH